jgi:hypothetical protein
MTQPSHTLLDHRPRQLHVDSKTKAQEAERRKAVIVFVVAVIAIIILAAFFDIDMADSLFQN